MTNTKLDFWVENEKLYATLTHMAQDIYSHYACLINLFSEVERTKYFLRQTNNTFSIITHVLNLTITN